MPIDFCVLCISGEPTCGHQVSLKLHYVATDFISKVIYDMINTFRIKIIHSSSPFQYLCSPQTIIYSLVR